MTDKLLKMLKIIAVMQWTQRDYQTRHGKPVAYPFTAYDVRSIVVLRRDPLDVIFITSSGQVYNNKGERETVLRNWDKLPGAERID